MFLCSRPEIKTWIDWVTGKCRDKFYYKKMRHGGYVTLYIHVVRVYTSNLLIPNPRFGTEFVVKDRIQPRAIVPIRVSFQKKLDLSKLNSTLKRLNELKMRI